MPTSSIRPPTATTRSASFVFIGWFGSGRRIEDRSLEIEFLDAGVRAVVFTFG